MTILNESLIEKLAQALWALPEKTYLLTASYRLEKLAAFEPEILAVLGVELEDLVQLNKIDLKQIVSSAQFPKIEPLIRKLRDETKESHPFHNMRNSYPSFIIALTSLLETHPRHNELEQLLAQVLLKVMQLNLCVDEDNRYQEFKRAALRSALTGGDVSDGQCQIGVKKLRQVSLALRSFVDSAVQQSATNDDASDELFKKLSAKANGFIKLPVTPQRKTSAHSKSSIPRKLERTKAPHRDSIDLLNLINPSLDIIYEILPSAEVDEPQVIKRIVYPELVRKAEMYDYSPAELIDPLPTVSKRVHDYHSPQTARISGQFQAKAFANRSELLRWSVSNATPAQVKSILDHLINLPCSSSHAFGAFLILTSIVSGRLPESLIGRIEVGRPPKQKQTSLKSNQQDLQPLVYFSIEQHSLYLLVNKPPVKTVSVWAGANKTHDYLQVYDFLNLGHRLTQILGYLDLSATDLGSLDSTKLFDSVDFLYHQLKIHGYSPQKIWQILPRTLQNESGQNGAMALLTDWKTLNSHVELHYLCIDSDSLRSRYDASLMAIMSYKGALQKIKEKPRFVGSPNCPTSEAIQNLVAAFERQLSISNKAFEIHNLMTLYTLAVATAGFGLRHAISPTIKVFHAQNLSLLSYTEKGVLRQIVMPELVSAQLKAYEAFRRVNFSPFAEKLVPGKLDFFLLKEDLKVQTFKPESFQMYLASCGIKFDLKLNSLRRWMFSQLFQEGQRGVSTDFYGGHGVEGREPFSTFSSAGIDSLIGIANTMDRILRRSWCVLEST